MAPRATTPPPLPDAIDMVRIAGLASWAVSVATRRLHLSSEACALLGVAEAGIDSVEALLDRAVPEHRAALRAVLLDASQPDTPNDVCWRVRDSDVCIRLRVQTPGRAAEGGYRVGVMQRVDGPVSPPVEAQCAADDDLIRREETAPLQAADMAHPAGSLAALVDALPGMAYRCRQDADWTMIWVSAGVEALTGYRREEIVGNRVCSYASLIRPDDLAAVADEVARATAARDPFRLGYRLRHRDGSVRWVWEEGRAIRQADGRVVAIEGYVVDVTPLVDAERQRDELAGREQAARAEAVAARAHFRALFEAAPGKFLVLAVPDLRIVAVSDAYLAATATRRADLLGKRLFEAFPDNPDEPHADGVHNLHASLQRVLAFRVQDAMPIQRYPIPRPDGGFEERYWSPVNAPVIGDDGRIHYVIHRVEDVTDFVRVHRGEGVDVGSLLSPLQEKEAELYRQAGEVDKLNDRLRESEALFRRVFDAAPLGLAVLHPDGSVALANTALQAMLGSTAAALRETGLAARLHPEGREDALARDAAVFDGSSTGYRAEERYCRHDGGVVHTQVSVTALHTPTGAVASLLKVVQDVTEPQRLADQLRRREALARIAGRLALVGGWALEVDSMAFEWSPEVHHIVGWPDERALPTVEQIWALHPPQWQRPLQQALQQCIDRAQPYRIDAELRTPAGERKWVTVAAEPEVDSDGRVRRVVGVLQDITAQRAAADELDRVAASLQATLRSMSDAFYLVDHDWRFVFVNPQAERLLNRRAQDLIGRSLWEEFPEAAQTPAFGAYAEAMQDGRSRNCEVWYAPLANWFEISVHPSSDGLAVYFRQISERKELMAQLVASEQRFRNVAEATADAVWDWDLLTDAIWWSRGFEALFGYRTEEVEADSRSWTTRIHPDDLTRVLDGIHAVIDGVETQWRDEYRFRCKDGRYAHVADRGFVLRDVDGRPLRMLGGMTDMTERLEGWPLTRKKSDNLR